MPEKIYKTIAYKLMETKNIKISFKVARYNKDEEFFYKEFLYKEEGNKQYVSAEIDASSMISLKFKNFEKESRNFVLYPMHRTTFLTGLKQVLDIFTKYDNMSIDERNEYGLYEMVENKMVIGLKHRGGVTVSIYGDVIIHIKPTILEISGQNFPGIMITYKNEVTFRFILNKATDIYNVIKEVNYQQMTLDLLRYSPPIEHGKYTINLHPSFEEKSGVTEAKRPVRRSPFANIKTN